MKPKISGIYLIELLNSGRFYVGSSVDILHRWDCHKSDLIKNSHHSILLQRAWNKYGADNFEFKILELVKNIDNLFLQEQYWIDGLGAACIGFNISPYAERTRMSPASILKGAKKRTGQKRTLEARAKMRAAKLRNPTRFWLGKKRAPVGEKTRKKLSLAHKGRIYSKETLQRMSTSSFLREAAKREYKLLWL